MKRLTLLFTLAFALFFAGCDEKDNGKNGDPNTDSKVGIIKSISYKYSHYEDNNFSVNLSYDDKGRLVKFVNLFTGIGEVTFNYSEDGKKANFVISGGTEHEDGSFEPKDYNCVANFNNDGNMKNIYGDEELWYEWIYDKEYVAESRTYGTYDEEDVNGDYTEGAVITRTYFSSMFDPETITISINY